MIFRDITGHDYYCPARLPLSLDELRGHRYLLHNEFMRLVVIAANPGDPDLTAAESQGLIDLCKQEGGNLVLVNGEAGAHKRNVKVDYIYNSLFARARHHRIGVVIESQTVRQVGVDCRAMASEVFCFAQYHPRELATLYDDRGDLFAQAVAGLQIEKHEYAHWNLREQGKWWSAGARSKYRGHDAAEEKPNAVV